MNPNNREFSGKVVFVTGAGTGNGAAIAERFVAAGAQVALVSRSLALLSLPETGAIAEAACHPEA